MNEKGKECRLVFKYDVETQPHIKIQAYDTAVIVFLFLGGSCKSALENSRDQIILAARMAAGAGPFTTIKCAAEHISDFADQAVLFRQSVENYCLHEGHTMVLMSESCNTHSSTNTSTTSTAFKPSLQNPIENLPKWHNQKNQACYDHEEFELIYGRLVENFKNSQGHPALDMTTSKNARKLRNYVNSVTSRQHSPKIVDTLCLRLVKEYGGR